MDVVKTNLKRQADGPADDPYAVLDGGATTITVHEAPLDEPMIEDIGTAVTTAEQGGASSSRAFDNAGHGKWVNRPDDGNNDIDIDQVGIKALPGKQCVRCSAIFGTRNALHKH